MRVGVVVAVWAWRGAAWEAAAETVGRGAARSAADRVERRHRAHRAPAAGAAAARHGLYRVERARSGEPDRDPVRMTVACL